MATGTGLCECGCGQITGVWEYTRQIGRQVRGQHKRFIHGHQLKGENSPTWKGDDAGVLAIHRWVRKHRTMTGVCEHCGATIGSATELANISGQYYGDIDDYYELCKPCHKTYDEDGKHERG